MPAILAITRLHVFWTYTILGTYTCHEDDAISLTVGSNYNLSTKSQFSNGNPTNTWGFSFNTTLLDQHNVGFTNSANQTNGERHSTAESATALFDGMQFRGPGDTWSSWTRSVCWQSYTGAPGDPDYNNQLLSNTKVQVSTAAPQC